MTRRVEPDPQTWGERYGHRLEPPPEQVVPTPSARIPSPRRAHGAPSPMSGAPMPGAPMPGAPLPGAPGRGDRRPDGGALSEESIVRPRDQVPAHGWRRWLHRCTGGLLNPGPGGDELARDALLQRIQRPLPGMHRIAVTSIKGGVGKTTVAACLGLVLAQNRGDRVIVLDANPDAGTLADRLTGESAVTVRELLRDLDRVHSWADMSRYTSLAGRLQVVASEQDPTSSDAFSREEYEHISALLGRFFNLTVTDSGTGLVHSAMAGTLKLADSLIVVGAPTVDGASRAAKTLDWLLAHGHSGLAADALVVLSHDRVSTDVDAARIRAYFAARCRAVVDIPHDPHLAIGARIDLARLHHRTHDAFLELGALVTDRFPVLSGSSVPPARSAGGLPPRNAGVRPARVRGDHASAGPTLER